MFPLRKVFILLMLCLGDISNGHYNIPPVILEAYEASGLRVSIPADSNIELFAFHGKVNEPLNPIETGDFSGEVKRPQKGFYTYFNPNLKLKVGDVVHYWYFIQHDQLGYRRDGQKWTVNKLEPQTGSAECKPSVTKMNTRTDICKGAVIFEDDFALRIDERKWSLEQYMPGYPDFEFVLYKKDSDVVFVQAGKLLIKPKLRENKEELTKVESIYAELGEGCTKPQFCKNETYLIKNPVISARLESKVTFSYGEFEIKAKVPSGDWIIPEIYLEDEQMRRILIAYTRGNQHLTGNSGDDLGNTLLFGGPVAVHKEPEKSNNLRSYQNVTPLSQSSHVYKIRWTPDQIDLFVDDIRYGKVTTQPHFTGSNPSMFKLVFGLGVGGLHDFPDGYKSGGYEKPWINYKRTQVLDFFNHRNQWYPTWSEEGRQLQIEYVKVKAL